MGRHRAPAATLLSRLLAALVDPAGTEEHPVADQSTRRPVGEDRIVLTEMPAQPHTVRLDYPDGTQARADWQYAGPAEGDDEEKYIVQVPVTARAVNGMIIHADRKTVLAVEIADESIRFLGR